GLDYNKLRISRAQQRGNNAGLSVADVRTLPLKSKSCDVAFCNHVLEHIADDSDVLEEMKRILSDTGIGIISVPNEGCALARLRNTFIQPSIQKTTDHVHFFTLKTLRSKLSKAGFAVIATFRMGFFFPHLGISSKLLEFRAAEMLFAFLGKLFPSQSAEMIITVKHDE
ncbi:MAG: methyltransferase domain-containing protein, partial [Elusimicrobia bacterium]|nr:methyltransferase domain-containing protein [Elusimicrobiota bacterium]MBD3412626.1 methyltransferase domain-containing protein [Elusimicrobiota bacterium]